jgi:hypothetical protein
MWPGILMPGIDVSGQGCPETSETRFKTGILHVMITVFEVAGGGGGGIMQLKKINRVEGYGGRNDV